MGFFRRIFDFYLRSSIHVALAVYGLTRMTQHMFALPEHHAMPLFAFFSTVAGYNFVKYHTIVLSRPLSLSRELKAIVALSLISLVYSGYYFLKLGWNAQLATMLFALLTVLYTLPFFPNRKNARNWAGVKIYIVSLCWVGVTVVMPALDAGLAMGFEFFLKCVQRFILVFVLILIFEIIDLAKDDPLLQTVPQQIGARRTKLLGMVLLVIFYILEFLREVIDPRQLAANLILVMLTMLLLAFADEKRGRYYSAFWTESIPILWWLLIVVSDAV